MKTSCHREEIRTLHTLLQWQNYVHLPFVIVWWNTTQPFLRPVSTVSAHNPDAAEEPKDEDHEQEYKVLQQPHGGAEGHSHFILKCFDSCPKFSSCCCDTFVLYVCTRPCPEAVRNSILFPTSCIRFANTLANMVPAMTTRDLPSVQARQDGKSVKTRLLCLTGRSWAGRSAAWRWWTWEEEEKQTVGEWGGPAVKLQRNVGGLSAHRSKAQIHRGTGNASLHAEYLTFVWYELFSELKNW